MGRAFCDWLAAKGLNASHTGITRAVLEQYLAEMHERVAPATVAKHYRSLQQLFRWLVVDVLAVLDWQRYAVSCSEGSVGAAQ